MGQIGRIGNVVFGDASLSIWEEGLKGSWDERQLWNKSFKRQVFKRIVQTLNRIGWKCVVPADMVNHHGRSFAENHRYCVKGELKADLSVSGRCIKLDMFQNVNAPDRPDNGGRYQSDKEHHMPYLLRLEMERARRKIRRYLLNVFSGYQFREDRPDGRSNKCGPEQLTAMEWLEGCYQTSWHFKGDLSTYTISGYNRRSKDGVMLEHGQRVYFFDHKGCIRTGIAYYNINNMWWVIWGKYGHTNLACFELLTSLPDDFRRKRNEDLRAKKLKALMGKAVEAMQFERAVVLRDLLHRKTATR